MKYFHNKTKMVFKNKPPQRVDQVATTNLLLGLPKESFRDSAVEQGTALSRAKKLLEEVNRLCGS